jgi:hypothetical protein
MPTQERMTVDERFKDLHIMLPRYKQSSRKERSRLLSERDAQLVWSVRPSYGG